MFRQFKEKNKNLLRLKLKSALKIEQISMVLFTNKFSVETKEIHVLSIANRKPLNNILFC